MYSLLHDAIFILNLHDASSWFLYTLYIFAFEYIYICCLIAQLKLEIKHLITLVFVLFYIFVSFCLLRFFLSFIRIVLLLFLRFFGTFVFEAAGAREALRPRQRWQAAWTGTWPALPASASAYSCTIWPRAPTRTSCGSCSDLSARWPASRFVCV